MKFYLVFDIGGTTSRSGLYSPKKNKLYQSRKIKTPLLKENASKREYNGWLGKVFHNLIKDYDEIGEIEQVILGFPGPIYEGKIYRTPTMLGANFKKLIDLTEICQLIWPNTKVRIINDVTALGYFYVGKGYDNFCLITVGSGIGSKVFLSGEPVLGSKGRGGEIGHLKVCHEDNALRCDCGQSGHLGSISSGRGTLNFVKRESKRDEVGFQKSLLASYSKNSEINNNLIVKAFLNNDDWVEKQIKKTSSYLANTMAGIHSLIGIEKFIINGGYAISLGEKYRVLLVEEIKKYCWNLGQNWDKMIILGSEPNSKGLIGAGIYGKLEHNKNL